MYHRWNIVVAAGVCIAGCAPVNNEPKSRVEEPIVPLEAELALGYRAAAADGRLDDAVSLAEQALAIQERTLGPEHPAIGDLVFAIATLQVRRGRNDLAEPLFRRALEVSQKAQPVQEPTLALRFSHFGIVQAAQGKYAEAMGPLRRGRRIFERLLAGERPNPSKSRLFHAAAENLYWLGTVYARSGRLLDAEPLLRQALAIQEQLSGPQHLDVVAIVRELALLKSQQRENAESEALFDRVLAIQEQALGTEDPAVVETLLDLAPVYDGLNKLEDAERVARRALAVREKTFPHDDPKVAACLDTLAIVLGKEKKNHDAERLCRRALDIREKAFGPDSWQVAGTLANLAMIVADSEKPGKYAEAQELNRRALAIQQAIYGAQSIEAGAILCNIAGVFKDEGKYAEATRLFDEALAIYAANDAARGTTDSAFVLNWIADLQEMQGRITEAEALRQRAQAIRDRERLQTER